MARSLRPGRADDLGLRRALSDRLLPLLVAAMTFLAALALAGAMAASGLAQHWRGGAASLLTVQIPDAADAAPAGGTRLEAVRRDLATWPGVSSVRVLPAGEVAALLRPWLGTDADQLALRLPVVLQVQQGAGEPASEGDAGMSSDHLAAALAAVAPGAMVERNGSWLQSLTRLAASLQACAALSLLVVACIAAAVVSLATRAGLAARRDAIEIVHGLGATDGRISGLFAARITALVFGGSLLGAGLVVPVVVFLAQLASPFQAPAQARATPEALLASLPVLLWAGLGSLPAVACAIAWSTAQWTVRSWLGRLP